MVKKKDDDVIHRSCLECGHALEIYPIASGWTDRLEECSECKKQSKKICEGCGATNIIYWGAGHFGGFVSIPVGTTGYSDYSSY